MLLFLPNTKLLLHTRQFLSYKIDINTITDKEKKWPTNDARILMQALELRVSVWTSFQKWKENQPESSLPCISWKAKPQPFPLSSVSGRMRSSRITLAPWWGKVKQEWWQQLANMVIPALIFQHLKQNPHSIQSFCASCLKSTRNSSPPQTFLCPVKSNLQPRDSDLDTHIHNCLDLSNNWESFVLNSHNLTCHLTLSTSAP